MSGPSLTALAPVLILAVVLSIDFWVYADAKSHARRGAPVVFSSGVFRVDTPAGWLLGCLLLFFLFFPLYMFSRG